MEPTAQPQQQRATRRAPRVPHAVQPRVLIEDHALIGDLHTAALVGKDGAIDFLCLPDFDSDACFASLLGGEDNGFWRISPTQPVQGVRRRYRGDTLILETELSCASGAVRLVDFMPIRDGAPQLVRFVEGVRGEVKVRSQLQPRFANGLTTPSVRRRDGTFGAVAGPDALYLRGRPGAEPPGFDTELTVRAGDRVPFVLSWAPPYEDIPRALEPDTALEATEAFWLEWIDRARLPAGFEEVVKRSLLTLKACCFEPTGAIVAAPTFGLPETPGGERNWDYRFCWVRDASLRLHALMRAGMFEEGKAFGRWLIDAVGGAPGQLQIMYGLRGERRLTEVTLPWLQGYGGAVPVRIGNGAYDQFQLDVLGEFAAVLHTAVELQGTLTQAAEGAFRQLAQHVERVWRNPDHGIWEMRGPKRPFTASKVAAWAAVDRWLRVIDQFGLQEDRARWERLRQHIFDEVLSQGYDAGRNTFTQFYGSKQVDASLLFVPATGMLPATDPRVVGTVKAIEEELLVDGLVLRYRTDLSDDGLEGEEGTFLACSFWLALTYQLQGRTKDARALFDRVVGFQNDVGLLAEEYLPRERQQLGNFPQAFSHLALVNCAYTLAEGTPPAESTRAPQLH
ncbi:glycoside hydrolase family 15 protein [Aggregicoccus sp. 17bor-14]|uniref:glycoside hydrolase family 15 protein n=1 Tax=Myxococcaceae TaxID=31 RepID=UPI00129C7382|nr:MULTISPECIES: glycoside hydrolase family 15 protein [Myxococcaceae]MBF5043094.1 glycoside hydrolase family 15 protein [Simulacricoccus sp. 17bor-14]MRI88856.1 glycoside hydrolase family 15 protein [Aggregicoccus sp. 17bor-14]